MVRKNGRLETRNTLDRHTGEVLAEVYALLARRGRELRAAKDDQPVTLDTVPGVHPPLNKAVRSQRTKNPQRGQG